MTKEQLFKKYHIDESHAEWVSYDNWISVELYRVMHDGKLPPPDDMSANWIIEFLDNVPKHRSNKQFGSLYLTAKRMVYSMHEIILESLNKN